MALKTVLLIGASRGIGFELVRTQRKPEHRGAFLNHDGTPLPW